MKSTRSRLSAALAMALLLIGLGELSGGDWGVSVQETLPGTVIKMKLHSAPFPHPERREGFDYSGVYFPFNPHYSDSSVLVFVPKNYLPQDATNLVFFFHGHYSSIDQAARGFSLFKQFAESGANALLVLAETARNAPDSFGGKLEDEDGFENLVGEILEALNEHAIIHNRRPGSISLAGHSGGYRAISRILALGGLTENVDAVYLFDGLYAGMEDFSDWIERSGGRFVSVYSINGSTSEKTEKFIESLRDTGIQVAVTYDDPSIDLRDIDNRVVFVQSRSDHFDLVTGSDEFRRLLNADYGSN